MSFISAWAFLRSTSNFFQNWFKVFRKLSVPSSISSSSSSMAAVYSTFMMSWKCSTSRSTTRKPSSVGWILASRFSVYSRASMVAMMLA